MNDLPPKSSCRTRPHGWWLASSDSENLHINGTTSPCSDIRKRAITILFFYSASERAVRYCFGMEISLSTSDPRNIHYMNFEQQQQQQKNSILPYIRALAYLPPCRFCLCYVFFFQTNVSGSNVI